MKKKTVAKRKKAAVPPKAKKSTVKLRSVVLQTNGLNVNMAVCECSLLEMQMMFQMVLRGEVTQKTLPKDK